MKENYCASYCARGTTASSPKDKANVGHREWVVEVQLGVHVT